MPKTKWLHYVGSAHRELLGLKARGRTRAPYLAGDEAPWAFGKPYRGSLGRPVGSGRCWVHKKTDNVRTKRRQSHPSKAKAALREI